MTNICHSGGATGADTIFAHVADSVGHTVKAFSFRGHNHVVTQHDVVLPETELAKADVWLKHANRIIQRKFPTSSWHTNNLLRRNYFQVVDSTTFYGLVRFKHGIVAGGTAWAFQMFVDMHAGNPAYVYDIDQEGWSEWTGEKFQPLGSRPPAPSGLYAGVGSRDTTDKCLEEVYNLYHQN